MLDLYAWMADLDHRDAMMRASTKLYDRYERRARQLTVHVIRCSDQVFALAEVARRLRRARHPSGFGHFERVWSRAEIGILIVESTNRYRQLVAILQGRPEREKGPAMDPRRIPDDRLDVLIQSHPDLAVVDRLRAERQRRAA